MYSKSWAMRLNYKPIGDYIRHVKVKNTDLQATELLGININKHFMPSVANVVGTNLARYKVVNKNQFACNRMHVGRDYRIPVALSDREEAFMVSPAYDVFEIIDTTILLPEYLMMWFSRAEYDRNAWFYTDADVRGGLAWDAFCNMQFPLPSIEKQREIVKEYNTIKNRIVLNNQLIQKLEETAQAIYKQWFVDFEFPNEDGKPYKSSGGKMVWNEELDKEIPQGWEVTTIKDFCIAMKSGGTPSRTKNEYWDNDDVPWLKTGEIGNNIIMEVEEYISRIGFENSSAKMLPKDTVLMAMYGATAAQVAFLKIEATTNQACCCMICKNKEEAAFLYYHLLFYQGKIANMANGGAQPNLSKNLIEGLKLVKPDFISKMFYKIIDSAYNMTIENSLFQSMNELLLSKIATIEN